jgi:Uma2 family endonuclease
MKQDMIRVHRWTRRKYDRMIKRGIFGPEDRVELLDGVLVVKEPQDTPHATAIDLVAAALRLAFGPRWLVRAQAPMAADRRSEPEPDVYVVPGAPRDYLREHPTRPALVVEVAHSRLRLDRTRKAAIYARAGVEDYWILNLVDRVLEIHREPSRLDTPHRRWGYRSIRTLGPEETVSPLAVSGAHIAVADLLP